MTEILIQWIHCLIKITKRNDNKLTKIKTTYSDTLFIVNSTCQRNVVCKGFTLQLHVKDERRKMSTLKKITMLTEFKKKTKQ